MSQRTFECVYTIRGGPFNLQMQEELNNMGFKNTTTKHQLEHNMKILKEWIRSMRLQLLPL